MPQSWVIRSLCWELPCVLLVLLTFVPPSAHTLPSIYLLRLGGMATRANDASLERLEPMPQAPFINDFRLQNRPFEVLLSRRDDLCTNAFGNGWLSSICAPGRTLCCRFETKPISRQRSDLRMTRRERETKLSTMSTAHGAWMVLYRSVHIFY